MLSKEFIYAPTSIEGFVGARHALNAFVSPDLRTIPPELSEYCLDTTSDTDLQTLPKEFAMVMAARIIGAASFSDSVENPYYLTVVAENATLRHESYYDVVTGHLNRSGLLQWAEDKYRPNNNSYGIFAVDLVNFKSVNDSLGHFKGDDALKAACDYITSIIRVKSSDEQPESDKRIHKTSDIMCVARFGGDEIFFVMDFNGLDPERAAKAIERVTNMLDTTELTMSCDNDVLKQKFGFRTGAVLTGPQNPLTFDHAIHVADKIEREKRRVQKSGHLYVNAAEPSTVACSGCVHIQTCFNN